MSELTFYVFDLIGLETLWKYIKIYLKRFTHIYICKITIDTFTQIVQLDVIENCERNKPCMLY